MWTKIMLIVATGVGFIALIGVLYYRSDRQAGAAWTVKATPAKRVLSADEPLDSEYVLEVIGLGANLDSYRQGALWDALARGTPYTLIRDMDPKHHPWQGGDKSDQSLAREIASVENALLDTPRYWGAPVFNAEPLCLDEKYTDRPESPQGGIAMRDVMMHMPVLTHRELSDRPDRIIEKVFAFFDQNPSVPYIILGSSDSSTLRAQYSSTRKRLDDGWYAPEQPDASAVFVLARRERVDALRPFVFQDLEEPQADVDVLNRDGIARRVWLNYLALENKVPTRPEDASSSMHTGRRPTNTEWLADLEIFAKQFSGSEPSKVSFKLPNALNIRSKPTVSRKWTAMPWFPVPWNTEQLEQFDKLPTLGFLHRPVFVKMTDSDGKLLKQVGDREAALREGWKAALETLPEAQRAAGPSRVIVATGGKSSQLVDFHGLLRKVAEDGGPTFDPAHANKFIDIDHRLGNTGAATFFIQTAIGVLGSYREGGVSAAFNLRDPGEASIIFISPPPDEKRTNQQHPMGGDVFQNATVPLIDPRNYDEPVSQ